MTFAKCHFKKNERIRVSHTAREMEEQQNSLYYKGYLKGYQDGVRDALQGKTSQITKHDISQLPVKAISLSTRAQNCLTRAGCNCVADVAALSDQKIAAMRNLGTKTASEVARWLDANGIRYSAWNKYL